ncbi:MAG: MarR family winged helix-turn-helix transcriptional regulator [Demequina sp.]|uniref:MarR family winged helix-turn-helix transcriptional regulator n=1 Tax=Demequina sp. TaxID=2050685 RepID=UPI003A84533C
MSRGAHIGTAPERTMAGLLARVERTRHVLEQRVTVGTADMRLLWLLSDGDARTMRQICDALKLEQSTVHRQVANAEKEGFVSRHRAAGSTAWVVTATDTGRAAFERALTSAMAVTGAGLAVLEPDEQEALLDLLGRFLDAYTEAVTGDPAPTAP